MNTTEINKLINSNIEFNKWLKGIPIEEFKITQDIKELLFMCWNHSKLEQMKVIMEHALDRNLAVKLYDYMVMNSQEYSKFLELYE